MPLKTVHLILKGRVQGVGFRYFARYKAEEFEIKGWVQNTPDGKVEIEAEGEPQNLATFMDWIRIGPTRARIDSFSSSEIGPPRNFTNFTIR